MTHLNKAIDVLDKEKLDEVLALNLVVAKEATEMFAYNQVTMRFPFSEKNSIRISFFVKGF